MLVISVIIFFELLSIIKARCHIGLYTNGLSYVSPSCRKCPQKCEEGFCQLGPKCVKGCQDSYYGTACKSCPTGCEVCNRVSGTCDFFGDVTSNYIPYTVATVAVVSVVIVSALVIYAACRYKRRCSVDIGRQQEQYRSNAPVDTNPSSSVYFQVDESTEKPPCECGPETLSADGDITDLHEYVNFRGPYRP